ncbi:MAG: hypothetical protein H5U18_03290 [Rhodobacteraceae bacterium]|nr:hypothetical protein [Paracoccaceae bacterium]
MRLHDALGARLAFPAAIPERLGLALARALEDAGFAARLADRLRKARPASAEAELMLLEKALAERGLAADGLVANGPAARTPGAGRDRPVAVPDEAIPEDEDDAALPAAPGKVHLRRLETGGILIYGTGADRAFEADLAAWIAARQDRDQTA